MNDAIAVTDHSHRCIISDERREKATPNNCENKKKSDKFLIVTRK